MHQLSDRKKTHAHFLIDMVLPLRFILLDKIMMFFKVCVKMGW